MKITPIETVSDFVRFVEDLPNANNLWFRGVARTSYTPVPGLVWRNISAAEGTLEHSFLISYKSYIEDSNISPWELMALMQHHGLPTRLLDWSESALVALYFALTSEPKHDGERVVWILDPFALNKQTIGAAYLYCPAVIANKEFTIGDVKLNIDSYLGPNLKPKNIERILPEKPIAINATQHLKRISAQKGCFTVHGYSLKGIETYLSNPDDFQMIKISIKSKSHRVSMITALAVLGVDEEFIFKDLDSLCEKIKRINQIHS